MYKVIEAVSPDDTVGVAPAGKERANKAEWFPS